MKKQIRIKAAAVISYRSESSNRQGGKKFEQPLRRRKIN